MFCTTFRQTVYEAFLFYEATVIGVSYRDYVKLSLFPKLEEAEPQIFIWHQDGVPPHVYKSVHNWCYMTAGLAAIGRMTGLFLFGMAMFTRFDAM